MYRHRGGWRRTSRRTVEAVRKAAGSVEVAQEAALEDCPGPVDSRAGGARETEKIFRQNIETEAGVIGGAVEKVGAITAGAVEKVGAVTDGAVEKVGAITGGAVEKVGAVPDKTRRRGRSC